MAEIGNKDNNGTADTDQFVPSLDDVLGTGVGSDRDDSFQKEKNKSKENEENKDKPKDEGGKDTPAEDPKKENQEPQGTPQERVTSLLKSFANDDLTEDNKELKAKLLSEFKGEKFDENGNILDKEGKVVKNADDVFNSLSNEPKGEEEEKVSLVDEWHKNSDYEFVDEDGKVKTYGDDEEGMQSFADDMANARLEEYKSQFFSQNKELTEVAKHLLSGGKLEDFGTIKDYSKISTKDLSTDEKINYIRESFEKRKFSSERIKDAIQRIKDSNTVDKETEYALEDLQTIQKEADNERDARFAASEAERAKNVETYWNNIESEVKKGNLNGVQVEDKDKAAFMDYLSKPVNAKGQSQADIDRSNEKLDARLAFEFFRFKNYNFDTFINNKVKTNKAQSLRELVQRSANIKDDELKVTNANKDSNKSKAISIDELLG